MRAMSVGVPAEAMRERREEHRRIGEPAADDHVGVGLERRHDRVGAEIGVHADHRHADVGERAGLVHEGLIGRHERGDVVAFDAGDLQALEPELARDRERALGRGARIGRAHIGDHRGAGLAAGGQQRAHAPLQQRIVAARGIGHAVAVGEGDRALAQAFQHDGVELAALDQIDGGVEPVGGEARAGADAERSTSSVALQNAAIPGKNRSSIEVGACLIEPIFAMN